MEPRREWVVSGAGMAASVRIQRASLNSRVQISRTDIDIIV
jgi:hypothetical protein